MSTTAKRRSTPRLPGPLRVKAVFTVAIDHATHGNGIDVTTDAAGRAQRVPILMYHEVSPATRPRFAKYVVSPQAFARQMSWLRGVGYTSISFATLCRSLIGSAVLPSLPVIITFDDGFRDATDYAPAILDRHRLTATFFFVAGFVGETSRWMASTPGVDLPLAPWTKIRALADAGFECGAHSLTHPRLAGLADPDCRRELVESREILESALRRPVVHLAYPYGSVDARVRQLAVEAGYHTGCSVDIGVATVQDDLMMLRRVPVTGQDSLLDFAWRLRDGHSPGETYRRWRQRRRDLPPGARST